MGNSVGGARVSRKLQIPAARSLEAAAAAGPSSSVLTAPLAFKHNPSDQPQSAWNTFVD